MTDTAIKAYLLNLIEFAYERRSRMACDFSDLISSCTSIRRCPAEPVDCIIITVKRRDWDGKVWKSVCWQPPRLGIFEQASELCWKCQVNCGNSYVSKNLCTVRGN